MSARYVEMNEGTPAPSALMAGAVPADETRKSMSYLTAPTAGRSTGLSRSLILAAPARGDANEVVDKIIETIGVNRCVRSKRAKAAAHFVR